MDDKTMSKQDEDDAGSDGDVDVDSDGGWWYRCLGSLLQEGNWDPLEFCTFLAFGALQ